MNISFIGFGNMAQAMAIGLSAHDDTVLRASAPSLTNGMTPYGVQTYTHNLAILPDADILILAVKPQHMNEVLSEISASLPKELLIISIAAGLSLAWYTKRCSQTPIIRAMPNLAASLGKSATPLIANEFVSDAQKKSAALIFNRLGLTTWVDKEESINSFTALSGSGLAYIFLFMDAMMNAAVKLGIEQSIASSFTLQTFNGAVSLATQSELLPLELQKKVTSPAGTTEAAIKVLSQHGFHELLYEAMKAAQNRAEFIAGVFCS